MPIHNPAGLPIHIPVHQGPIQKIILNHQGQQKHILLQAGQEIAKVIPLHRGRVVKLILLHPDQVVPDRLRPLPAQVVEGQAVHPAEAEDKSNH